MSRKGREAISEVRKWLGGTPGCPGVPLGSPGGVVRHCRMSGSGHESFLDVREGLRGTPESQCGVGRPS